MNTLTTSNLSKITIDKSKISLINYDESADCISREKAKQFLYERLDRLNDDELYDIFSRIIDDMYNELPPAIPKAKTGHWEMCEDEDGIYGVCDICGIDADFSHKGEAYPYCPNCGAKMEGEDADIFNN